MELYGRKTITTNEEIIDASNIVNVLETAYKTHKDNRSSEEYLYDMYRGKQDIRNKEKDTRPEINSKICENRALQFVDFRTGYVAGEPIVLTARDVEKSDEVSLVNDWFVAENKAVSDKELFDWMHICGHGYRMILPGTESPFEITTLRPMNTFVVYNNSPRKEPMMGVYYVLDEDDNEIFSCYTENGFFVIQNSEIVQTEGNIIGIPIIEYELNEAKVGVIENVKDLLDAINYLDSDRLDGVTTFINSLCVLYNAELPEGEDGNTIREKGLITLKSIGENKADIKILSEQLDQNAVQSLKDDLYNSALQIVGMPNQGATSDSSNNGAIYLKQGYQLAETRAKDTEVMFKKSEKEFLKKAFLLLKSRLTLADVDITFTRRAYSDINSKANVLIQLLSSNKIAPIDAWKLSGITPEPEEACKRGLENEERIVSAVRRTEQPSEGNNGEEENETDGNI